MRKGFDCEGYTPNCTESRIKNQYKLHYEKFDMSKLRRLNISLLNKFN